MKAPGLMMLLGGGKGDKEDAADEASPSEESDSPEDMYIDEFASAVKANDKVGMREAFKSAVKACMSASDAGTYDDAGGSGEEE